MTLHTRARQTFEHAGTVLALAVACSLPLVAQTQKPAPLPLPVPVPTVATSALERLMPVVDGWTKGRLVSNRVDLSETCAYSFADAVYTAGDKKVNVTLADTTGDQAALGTVATMVVTFGDGYSMLIDKTTTIKRLTLNGSPAAYRWNATTLNGEFIVVVGGRFVAKAEGAGVENIEVLRDFVEHVNLKALGELK